MRLAIHCPDFFPAVGGYSFAFQDLVRGLCGEGVEVDVFTPVPLDGAAELALPGLRVIRVAPLPAPGIRYVGGLIADWRNARRMAAALVDADRERRYDAVLSETIEEPMLILQLPRGLRARTVVRVHGCAETELAMWDQSPRWRFRRRLIRRALRRDVRYITATAGYYVDFVRRWFLDGDALMSADKRYAVVPNSAPSLATAPRRPDPSAPRRRFMTLGRMTWVGTNQKGFDDVLMALLELSPAARARIHLTIIGQGDERPRLMRIAEGIPDAVIEFVERAPNAEVHRLLGSVDGVVLASRYEGMSMFALEALGSGAPVLFSDAGGLAALVQGNGRRFVAGDPRSLAAAWAELLEATPAELEEMSRHSLRLAAELTPQRAAQALLRFLAIVRATT